MASKPRGRKKPEESTSNLLAALKFVSLSQNDSKAETQHTHVLLSNKWAVATNPVFAMGHKIDDDLNVCPHTERLIDALSKCGDTLSVTTLDSGRLSIKSDRFRAIVPCVNAALFPPVLPDTPCASLNDALRAGFEAVAGILDNTNARPFATCALLQAGTVVGCDGYSLAEYWHGIDLPPGLLIPKPTITALLKTDKPLAKLGYSSNSVTFYFDDESWISTRVVVTSYPTYEKIFSAKANAWPVPDGFYTAIKHVSSFNEQGSVYFNGNSISSHATDDDGATYEIDGIPANQAYNGNFILLFENLATKFDFTTSADKCFFFGENVRGAIAAVRR